MPPLAKTLAIKPISHAMLRNNTPVEDYTASYGLFVKREDLACFPPGPPFSKTRGVFARVQSRKEKTIGVLDTFHSQAGWAVARACQILGKECVNFYPAYKSEPGPHAAQLESQKLGAELFPLPAGRSAILYHRVKKECNGRGWYAMPNALKLEESVEETAKEVPATLKPNYVIIPASSGTIAAGVVKGFWRLDQRPTFIIHLGYSRSVAEVTRYINDQAGCVAKLIIIDEGYAYKDQSIDGPTPAFPCNVYYDLKAFRWHQMTRARWEGRVLFWNIG